MRSRPFRIAAVLATVWLGALALAVLMGDGGGIPAPAREPRSAVPPASQHAARGSGGGDRAQNGGPRPTEDEIVYGYDIYDERLVIGLSENVFLGLVRREEGHRSIPTSIPDGPGAAQTQFSALVLRSIKARGPEPLSKGEVALVSQYGGADPETGRPISVVGYSCGRHVEALPLEPGRRYVFATVYRPQGPFHLIVAQPTGALPVEGPPGPVLAAYEGARRDQTTKIDSDWGRSCD